MTSRPRVLFLCTHNSARSQMAEALLRTIAGDRYKALSAGTEVTRVHPLAIDVMAEIGISLHGHRSKHIGEFRPDELDVVVTVCDSAREACPVLPGVRTIHLPFRDPSSATGDEAERRAAFVEVRNAIADALTELIATDRLSDSAGARAIP